MGDIEKVGDLNKSHIGIHSWDLNLNGSFKSSPFEVRSVKIDESIQFDTNSQHYPFEKSQNYIIKCLSSQFAMSLTLCSFL